MAGIVTFCVNNLTLDFSGYEGLPGFLWFYGYEGLPGFYGFPDLKRPPGFLWFSGSEGAAGAAKAAEDHIQRIRCTTWR